MIVAVAFVLMLLQAPQSSINGVVVRSDTGAPIANAQVTLRGVLGPVPFSGNRPAGILPSVVTDSQGRFSFPGLNAGSYRLVAAAEGYTREEFRSTEPDALFRGTIFGLRPGRDLTTVIRLRPGGSVSGRITGPARESLRNVRVELLPLSYDAEGFRTFEVAAAADTNDRGEYRLSGVRPGRYWLRANPQQNRPTGVGLSTPLLHARYHPGVSEPATATPIEVRSGSETPGIDLVLGGGQTFSIRGRVVDLATGQRPVADALSLTIASQHEAASRSAIRSPGKYNADGTFEFTELLPGQYSIFASLMNSAEPRSGFLVVDVGNADAGDQVMTLASPQTVSGRIVSEGQTLAALLMAGGVNFTLRATSGEILATEVALTGPGADGNFRLSGIPPGEYWLRMEIPDDVFVREASLQSENILGRPLKIAPGSSGELRIVLSSRGGRIEGTVTDAQQRPSSGARVVLIPAAGAERRDLYKVDLAGSDGRFSIQGIAPGAYKLFAWEALENNSYFDANLVSAYEGKGKSIRVEESSVQTVPLVVIPED